MSDNKVPIPVIINAMKLDDLPAIMAIERVSFPTPWTEGMFERELESPHSHRLCARTNNEKGSVVAGYIIFWLVADEIHLHDLAVGLPYKGQGIALKLMEEMTEIARRNKVRAMTLEVRESNIEAIKLYQKCGFVVKGIRPLYYLDTREDGLIMWADVNP
jgi:[ribosomal protein S18]-alanine N-acetyltransferase